jgi:hypothetical protein
MKKIINSILSLFFFLGIFIPQLSAGMLPQDWDEDHFVEIEDIEGKSQEDIDELLKYSDKIYLPKSSEKGGLAQFQDLLINNIAQITRYLLISVAILYIFVNIIFLILGSSDEGNIDNVKKGVGYIILGLIIISLSSELAKIFDPVYSGGDIANEAQARSVLQTVINYVALIAGIVAVFNILIAALRLITAQGEEGVIDEQKKNFQYGFIGLIVIIMADVMINRVFYPQDIQAPAAEETATFAQEVMELLSYVLEFLGIFAVVSIVLAGGYYIVSLGNDEQTSSAKTIIKNLVIGFIIIFLAYVVVSAIAPTLEGQVIAQ